MFILANESFFYPVLCSSNIRLHGCRTSRIVFAIYIYEIIKVHFFAHKKTKENHFRVVERVYTNRWLSQALK
jgi:hypothetical protein